MARDHARIKGSPPNYMEPSPGELASLARRRYSRTQQGHASRTWRPSVGRMSFVRRLVHERDDYTCQNCALKIEPKSLPYTGRHAIHGLTLDHVIPYRDGGLFYPDNLVTLCESCNSRKGART